MRDQNNYRIRGCNPRLQGASIDMQERVAKTVHDTLPSAALILPCTSRDGIDRREWRIPFAYGKAGMTGSVPSMCASG